MKFLVTATAEVYRWEEASSEEEAIEKASKGVGWNLSNIPLKAFKSKLMLIDTKGVEVKKF